MTFKSLGISLSLAFAFSACDFSCASHSPQPKDALPVFNENLAYAQILAFEKFGPKIPGTPASRNAGDWIVSELQKSKVKVLEQNAEAKTFDGKTIPIRNIIAQINPEAKDRYLLSAHWDSRPFADEDPDLKYRHTPVPAVNDGGSGVVVLLGIAKALENKSLSIGVDLLFLDAEDWGTPSNEESYCLGTQYWAKNPVPANYQAKFGINYDMVGRIGSIFPVEINSERQAGTVIQKLQAAAQTLGYQDFFPKFRVGPVIDDHIYLMQGRHFPVADLIYMTPEGRFPPEWHTHQDTSEFISRDVLKVVGQTTLKVLWDEQQL